MISDPVTLTQSRLQQLLRYDAETGNFIRLVPRGPEKAGGIAGCLNAAGYWRVMVDGHRVQAHRLAWLYVTGTWPERLIDHQNGDRADNRWRNLRQADHHENTVNSVRRSDNRSGQTGVVWDSESGRWRASIVVKGRRRSLGRFDLLVDATAAYLTARRQLFTFQPRQRGAA